MPVPKISIIMPIHNTPAEYLEECLDSVFAQTFTRFELVCVDDASDDERTKILIDTYKSQHDNMRVICLEQRSGAAVARNTGFSYAKSEYVIFLDADDIFGKDFLLEMHRCIEEKRADFCVCGYTVFYNENQRKERAVYKWENAFHKDSDDWLSSIPTAPWSKLYRRRLLSEHHIYFQSLSSSNDVFFYGMCMICAKKICVLERDDLIFYRSGLKGQISANRDPVNFYKAVRLLSETAPYHDSGEKLWNWIGALLILGMLYELSCSNDAERSKELYSLVRGFFQNKPVLFENRILQACENRILELDYESNWHNGYGNVIWQLRLLPAEIKTLLAGHQKIYVWGRGKRGDAFQQFCKEQGIVLSGIADLKDSNIGEFTNFGNQILSTVEILEKESGLLVASNRKIYEDLKEKVKCSLMDLEEFCPI